MSMQKGITLMKFINLQNVSIVNKRTLPEHLKASYKSKCLKGAFLGVETVTIVVLFSDGMITDTGCGVSVCVPIQSCWTPSNPVEDSPPGFSVHGIL